MNKLTKVTFIALFSLFLSGCDKFNELVGSPSATEVAAQGAEEFKTMLEWNATQEKGLVAVQQSLQQRVETGEKAQIEEGLNIFRAQIDEVIKSLDNLTIKNPQVAEFKEKTKQTLILSNDLISESVKVIANPTPEAQQVIQQKSQNLIQVGQELQQIQLQLQQKFMPTPAAQ